MPKMTGNSIKAFLSFKIREGTQRAASICVPSYIPKEYAFHWELGYFLHMCDKNLLGPLPFLRVF